MNYYLAIDIGASSGRHIVGWYEDGQIKTDEVYRFANGVKEIEGHLVWDVNGLFEHVKQGIRAAFAKYTIKTLSIDTWGVDYVLLPQNGTIKCFSYRDNRTESAIAAVHAKIPFETLYERTGIQFQPFNTVYQLYDDLTTGRLVGTTDFLMIPEYLNYLLTGVKMKEYTNATTTGLVNAKSGVYDEEIIERLGFPKNLFGKLYQPGTVVGALLPEIASFVGGHADVVLCASHDTASAVEGIPTEKNCPYLSSGTWSLLGVKVPQAILDESSRNANYSNEGGVGYVRYQKNIMGMWIINRLHEELCPQTPIAQLVEEVKKSSFTGYVDVNDTAFLAPKSMKAAFDGWFEKSAVKPKANGDYIACAIKSLAKGYRVALEELRRNSGQAFDTLYIVGGGAKNGLLNELTAKECGVKVIALPIEATALGNLKIQIRRQENV